MIKRWHCGEFKVWQPYAIGAQLITTSLLADGGTTTWINPDGLWGMYRRNKKWVTVFLPTNEKECSFPTKALAQQSVEGRRCPLDRTKS